MPLEQNGICRRSFLRAALGCGATALLGRGKAATAPPAVHRVLTCNILLKLKEHEGTPLDWTAGRRDVCLQAIGDQQAHIICLQEMGPEQIDDFTGQFAGYHSFGFAGPVSDRQPPRFKGIRNVILYDAKRYTLLAGSQYTLSATPLIDGSRFNDRVIGRHVNWVRLRDNATAQEFRVLNTHLSLTPELRLQETKIIAPETAQYQSDFPQLLCGDLNSVMGSDEQRPLRDAGWTDTFSSVHPYVPAPGSPQPARRIDFILTRGPIRTAAASRFRGNHLSIPASDHPFFSADVVFG